MNGGTYAMLMSTAPDAICFVELVQFELDVLDISEPLNSQELLGDVLRRHTNTRYADQS